MNRDQRERDRFYILPTLFWKWGNNYRNGWSLHGGLFVQEKNSPSVSLLWVQWLTPLKTQSLCVCWQKSMQYKRFNSNTWHKIFWQNEPNITSNTAERQTSQPTERFYQTPDSSALLLWQTQNYFYLTEFLWSRWKHLTYCYLSSLQRCCTYSIMARLYASLLETLKYIAVLFHKI